MLFFVSTFIARSRLREESLFFFVVAFHVLVLPNAAYQHSNSIVVSLQSSWWQSNSEVRNSVISKVQANVAAAIVK